MVSLEQVKLLETKVARTIDYVKKVTEENSFLKGKLDSYQQRIDELEVLIKQFREDQSRIEDGILSALDRLNQFEDALESKLAQQNTYSSVDTSEERRENEKLAPPPVADEPGNSTDNQNLNDSSDTIIPSDPEFSQSPDNELDIF